MTSRKVAVAQVETLFQFSFVFLFPVSSIYYNNNRII